MIIKTRKATREEIGFGTHLIDEAGNPTEAFIETEDDDVLDGWNTFDGGDWDTPLFMMLKNGSWFVEVLDEQDILQNQVTGVFVVIFNNDGGWYKRI